ncbi:MAG: TRAP transporter small permease subunit [Thermodesulforhabdaceae bacterium]
MEKLEKVINIVNAFFSYIGAFFIMLIVVFIFMSIINRYFLNIPVNWPSEVSQYLQCAVVMLSASYCLQAGIHTRVDIFYGNFSYKKRMWINILSGFFVIGSSIPIVWYGTIIGWNSFMMGERSSSADHLPLWPSIIVVPLGAFFLGLQGLTTLLKSLITYINSKNPEGKLP